MSDDGFWFWNALQALMGGGLEGFRLRDCIYTFDDTLCADARFNDVTFEEQRGIRMTLASTGDLKPWYHSIFLS